MMGLLAWMGTYILLMLILTAIFPGFDPSFWEALGVVACWGTANIVQRAVES